MTKYFERINTLPTFDDLSETEKTTPPNMQLLKSRGVGAWLAGKVNCFDIFAIY
ncbi:MAG: hypothetical protein AAF386_02905 [Pseudomonadota bacterium]